MKNFFVILGLIYLVFLGTMGYISVFNLFFDITSFIPDEITIDMTWIKDIKYFEYCNKTD